ncbi:membrane protein [Mycolicibacter terrae]|uniref:Acyl-CoA:diacylglycerol acyltransferase n=2 Tax=Mycolicibacter terrae TaxID=1788 RepID=A0AAD1I097_9MYCO|nr:membrane protein [Mycolicibacter terrae]SNV56206.1 membrane protein [Mycolicibacter terrae]
MADLTRRAALRLGVGAAGAASLLGSGTLLSAESQATGNAYPTRESGSFVSAARGGLETNWIIARPPGQTAPLRPVIALHCKDGDAAWVMDLGVEEELAKLTASGRPPFAVVAVDGGNTYWRPHGSGEDSGAMVLTELIPMLADKGIDTSRVGFMGWSMGGYGAMLLGTRLGPARTAGICAISPAIYMTYFGAPAGAFDSVDDWRTNSAFSLAPRLAPIPLRVDCGTSDSFYYATNHFVGQLNPRPAGGFAPGGHDVTYWRGQLPAELAWLGS